ncbi:LysE family translocator [Andreprevotia lacus]|jgi:threonine/homoserine/homoserine lactone efflux protein|nr:LysE family translocator [Andreprevotia lacus]
MDTFAATGWFALSVALLLALPGPTNTLLAAAGLRRGVRASLSLAGVELLAYAVAISAWGLGLTRLAQRWPALPGLLRLLCAAYLLWLAWRMWRSTRDLADGAPAAPGWRALLTTTLLNPKALLFASSIFPAGAFADARHYASAMLVFAVVLLPISVGWMALGASLQRAGRHASPLRVQRGAALVLLLFASSLAWSALPLAR